MKKVISVLSFVFVLGVFSSNAQCCNKTAEDDNSVNALALAEEENESAVKAYYFHTSRRCVTCKTVEKVTTESLKELYGDKIQLKSVNLDNKENEELAKSLEVGGQSLLFTNGSKKVDITTDGFMNALRNPEKLKEKIKTTVESLK
ncbi:nitrophenyl compound nitroreductase subunit ArsF family protein [Mariniphaga sp.]|uniref:nitrophenyl compound nitroreductase subunit ArsF family protein n=1 Tax=Mariniphaga sp. TaxID=1954475 RepID=UPI003567E1AC